MAEKGEVYLGPTGSLVLLSAWGRTAVNINPPIEGGREDRTEGGTLKTDVTYVKETFSIQYDMIIKSALDQIITLQKLREGLELRIYDSSTTWYLNEDDETPIVKLSPVSINRLMIYPDIYLKGTKLYLQEI
jgi:hypothetical protein